MYRRYRRRPGSFPWPPAPGSARYRPSYPTYRPRNRAAEIITISVLVAAFFLLGLGGMLWALEARLGMGPTPTPTATIHPTQTPTPDFRTTRVVEDLLTQRALLMAQAPAVETPTPAAVAVAPEVTPGAAAGSTSMPEPPAISPGVTPGDTVEDAPTSTPVSMLLPGVISPGEPQSPLPVPESPTSPVDQAGGAAPTSTPNTLAVPIVVGAEPSPTAPGDIPAAAPPATDTPTVPADTPTPTATEVILEPTPIPPTPSPTPVATGSPYLVNRLRAYVDGNGAPAYLGPSTIYTQTGTLEANREVNLIGRSNGGEWVYVCCLDDEPVWARQFDVRPRGNELQPGAPSENTNPNDVRWLPVLAAPSSVRRLPVPTPIPVGDYPLPVYTRTGNGRVPTLPNPPLSLGWTAESSQSFTSPPAVGGSSVLVASADGHLYSFDRVYGSQRWRNNLGIMIRKSPIVYDGEFFVVDETGLMIAFEDRGGGMEEIWRASAGKPPLTSFNVYSDTLFLAVGQGADHELLAIDRDNGVVLRRFSTQSGPSLSYPVIGEQLVYVADNGVWALDVFEGGTDNVVWRREGEREGEDIKNVTAGPIYVTPGVKAAAELYVVTGDNRVFCLDANTGVEVWNFDNGKPATALSLTDTALLVAGNNYIRAISREAVTELWQVPVGGAVLGTPMTDGTRVIVLTPGGSLTYLDAATGARLSDSVIPAPAAAAAAISETWLYLPSTNGRMYALKGGS